jgi:enoyl-CoA hydratase/carnithine racemase
VPTRSRPKAITTARSLAPDYRSRPASSRTQHPARRLDRDAVHRGLASPQKEGLEVEADLNTLAFQTTDTVEGMMAFLEKRKPKFRDE